jgi:nitric oxide reductase NorD protein
MAPDSPEFQVPQDITRILTQELDPPSQELWNQSLLKLSTDTQNTLLELLQELMSHSTKATAVSLRKWESANRCLSPQELISWIDLGTALASHSATTAMKYFQDSLVWLDPLSSSQKTAVFDSALELTDRNYAVTLDFLKASPQAMATLPLDSLPLWMEPGLHLADADIVLAVEYFRISPDMLLLLPPKDLSLWITLGERLVAPNQLGKPDYLKAIEYFRLSPEIFSKLPLTDLRLLFLELATRLANISPQTAIEFLKEGPNLLERLPSIEFRRRALEQGLRLADRDPKIVKDYMKQVPEIITLLNNSIGEFEQWVDAGYRLLEQNLDKAKAYFNRRSKKGQETTEQLAGGIALPNIARVLRLYAEGLSGRHVMIKSMETLPVKIQESLGSGPTTDGRTIYLPDRIRLFSESQDNFRFYKVATLHEVGHLEFGTYDLDFSSDEDLIERIGQRYRKTTVPQKVTSAESFFSLYPDPKWCKALWEIIEDARIDYRLRYEYPGVRHDIDQIVAFELRHRPPLEGLPPKQAVREALIQLSITDTTDVPIELASIVSQAYDLLLKMKHPHAKALDALRILDSLYELLDHWLKTFEASEGETDPLQVHDQKIQEVSERQELGQHLKPSETFSYRGTMHPDWAKSVRDAAAGKPLPPKQQDPEEQHPSKIPTDSQMMPAHEPEHDRQEEFSSPVRERPSRFQSTDESAGSFFFYDEWDTAAQDYRPQWSRLVEKSVSPSTGTFVQNTLTQHSSIVKLLRRYFEGLKPEAFRKRRRQIEGEEMDLEALLEARIEALSGLTPTDRVYIKTEKRVRDVAVAFLLDMSGSTSQIIGQTRKRVIDVEKEGLVLLSEALQAVGDNYGIFGFSGQGQNQVEYFILKDFNEDARWALSNRIDAVKPLAQNRDGAAIRHTIYRLNKQEARTRLLILLSDGKPLDNDYTGSYALQDTKMALREARRQGIHPYCITIDREASRYLSEMYGEVRYTIIDNILTLPDRLPQIYRKLTT